MSAHTPGPYELQGDGAIVAQLGSKRTGVMLVTAPLTSALVPLTPEAVEANAHLLTAAPLMLSALEMVRDADDDCGRDGLTMLPPAARARIDHALATAKGGAL